MTELTFSSLRVNDISPVRALASLERLTCWAARVDHAPVPSPLADLSPLRGLRLMMLQCYKTEVSDLSPLAGMPLTELSCPSAPSPI